MPYTIWWEVEGHILYASYSGDVTVDELTAAMKDLDVEMTSHGGPFVNMITDMRNVQRQPSLTEVLGVIRQFETSEQLGWSLNVGDSNPLLRFMTTIAGQLMHQRMRSFDTPEEALAFLKENDPSIDWSLQKQD